MATTRTRRSSPTFPLSLNDLCWSVLSSIARSLAKPCGDGLIRDCCKTRPVHGRTGYQARPACREENDLVRNKSFNRVYLRRPMARRHRMPGKRLSHSAESQLSFATASDDLRRRPKIQALTAVDPGHYSRPAFESSTSCTNSQPKRPLMHRWPRVTSASRGEVTLTIRLSWTCKVSVQPTPQ